MALMIFDIDGTILNGDSNDQFFKCLLDHRIIDESFLEFNKTAGEKFYQGTLDILGYYRYVIKPIAGKTEDELRDVLTDYRENYLKNKIAPAASELIRKYHSEGHMIILASATMDLLVKQTAMLVGADDYIATRIKYDDKNRIIDVYPDFCHQEGKRKRLLKLCSERNLDLKGSHGYGDTINDLAMLQTVETAHVVNPGKYNANMVNIAREKNWDILSFK